MPRTRPRTKLDCIDILFLLLSLVLLLFIFVPLIKTSLSSSPNTLWSTLLDKEVYSSILLTLWAAMIATAVGLFLGIPLAYLLARRQFWGKRFIEGFIDLPIVIPHSAAGIALLFVFGNQFFFGKLFAKLGITFVDSIAGVVIAMMFVSVPFLIDSVKDGFKSVDIRLEKVALTLGASPWRVFFKISLPLAQRSIFSGSIMMWARGISEFGAVTILAYHVPFMNGYPVVTSILAADRFATFGLDSVRPIAALLILLSLVVFIVFRTITFKREDA